MFGGQVGLAGHIEIGDGVILGAQAGIANSVKSGEKLLGSPAVPIMDFKRNFILQKRLPSMSEQIKDLKKEIEALKSQLK